MSSTQRPIRIPDNIQLGTTKPDVARAGEKGSWILKFVLAKAIPQNQWIFAYIHGGRNNKGSWGNLQTDDHSKEGYVSLGKESGEKLHPVEISNDGGMVAFEVPNGGFKSGEQIIMELGGEAGTYAPRLSLQNKFFLLLTTSQKQNLRQIENAKMGKDSSSAPTAPATSQKQNLRVECLYGENLKMIAGACLIHVIGNDAKYIKAYTQSQAIAGKEISLLVRPEDEYGNVASEELGSLIVRLPLRAQVNGQEVKTKRTPLKNSTCCILSRIVLPKPGIYRLQIEDVSKGLKTVTNPIKCYKKSSSPNVLWGMIHGHTEISDGAGSLDHYFRYMKDKCGLDFGTTGDHDHLWETSDDMWKLTQEAVAKYNDPGRFTTFLGYEWAKWRKNGDGDRNVYYLHDRKPLLRSDYGCYPKPTDLFKALETETALIIPHHTAEIGNHCDWKDHDVEKERLVEIYSCWGNSERSVHQGNPFPVRPAKIEGKCAIDSGEVPAGFVQRALELGWRVGFTAGGDDHAGHPGDQSCKAGLMAVYADDNSRESIWKSLWNRRCYATTGARIIADFKINDYPMGSEILLSGHPEFGSMRKLNVLVHGTEQIKSVEIVRNNKDIYTCHPDKLDVRFDWTDTEPLADINYPSALYCSTPFTFYYIRITQIDGEMAWLSPVWIDFQ